MNRRIRPAARGLAVTFLLAAPGAASLAAPAFAQSDAARIAQLERAVSDLQGVVYSVEGGQRPARPGTVVAQAADGANTADAVVRLADLEQEVARLTGRIEELTFRLAEQQRQLDTVMEVMSSGGPSAEGAKPLSPAEAAAGVVAGIAAGQASQPAQATGPQDLAEAEPSPAPAPSVDLPDDPDAAYELAYEALLAGDYERAEAAFEAFVEAHPDSVQAPEAKYLLGEIYLATGAYAEAATLFLDHVRTYPDDPRAPEAYLKLGTAFARLDRVEEACKIFTAGERKFSDMPASVRARYAAEQGKVSCG